MSQLLSFPSCFLSPALEQLSPGVVCSNCILLNRSACTALLGLQAKVTIAFYKVRKQGVYLGSAPAREQGTACRLKQHISRYFLDFLFKRATPPDEPLKTPLFLHIGQESVSFLDSSINYLTCSHIWREGKQGEGHKQRMVGAERGVVGWPRGH